MTNGNPPASDLQIEIKGQVAHLTLNRPGKRNALSRQLLLDLEAAEERIGADGAVRAVVLAAQGPVFCAAAMEMLLAGKPITARRALELGLVNKVVPGSDLDAAVQSIRRSSFGRCTACGLWKRRHVAGT